LYGAVSQTNRIAFSLLRKLDDFLGNDFCGEFGVRPPKEEAPKSG
jgi:hypothetical protein